MPTSTAQRQTAREECHITALSTLAGDDMEHKRQRSIPNQFHHSSVPLSTPCVSAVLYVPHASTPPVKADPARGITNVKNNEIVIETKAQAQEAKQR